MSAVKWLWKLGVALKWNFQEASLNILMAIHKKLIKFFQNGWIKMISKIVSSKQMKYLRGISNTIDGVL